MDWRRLVAALCVGLIALLYVEAAHAEGHTDLSSDSLIYAAAGQVVHTHDEAGHEHGSGGAEHDGTEPHAHHCSMAHTAAPPSGGVELGCEQRALKAHPMRDAAWRLTSRLYGLERPPRA
ncbi:MAG: hypothetical protein AB7Q23_10290 [Hyphomonadaceae bacterium]